MTRGGLRYPSVLYHSDMSLAILFCDFFWGEGGGVISGLTLLLDTFLFQIMTQ